MVASIATSLIKPKVSLARSQVTELGAPCWTLAYSWTSWDIWNKRGQVGGGEIVKWWSGTANNCSEYQIAPLWRQTKGKGGTVAEQFHTEHIVNHWPANWRLLLLYVFYVFLNWVFVWWFGATALPHVNGHMSGTVHTCGTEVSSGLSWWSLACCLLIWCNLELRDKGGCFKSI